MTKRYAYDEAAFDTGEVTINYAVAGDPDRPAVLLVPALAESWWGYERAMTLLAEDFQVFAVDLRGHGRSTRTPGRYTFDNAGNDLVRFIAGRIGRPVLVSGASAGGVVAAWLSAYAPPGMIRAAALEDAPLFAAEADPPFGPLWMLLHKHLGGQWSIGDWAGLYEAARHELPPGLSGILGTDPATPPRRLAEWDPEWGLAFTTRTAGASCDHARMLSAVRVPVLFMHNFRQVDESTGALRGAISDAQARRAGDLVSAAGQRFDYRSFPDAAHRMHEADPARFVATLREWAA